MEDLEGKLKEASDARMRLIATDGDPPDRPSSHAKRHKRLFCYTYYVNGNLPCVNRPISALHGSISLCHAMK